MKRRATAAWCVIAAFVILACSAKRDVDVVQVPASAGGTELGGTASGGQATAGAQALAGTVSAAGTAVGVGSEAPGGSGGEPFAGAAAEGGAAAGGGTAGAATGGEAGAPELECPRGTLLAPHVPGDCKASACDGFGGTVDVVDLENRPAAKGTCWVGYCDAQGKPQQTPSAAGSACQGAGGKLCDGAGACVACLTQSDCAAGACIDHACVSNACSNGKRDGAETDVDCGGFCEPCEVGQSCKIDQDCASDSCEQVKQVCLPASCIDQQLTSGETDVDCGGPDCSPCYVGKHCEQNSDCVTNQCNLQKQACEGEPCIDKRLDGLESDVDCGGFYCHWCKAGQHCNAGFDCAPGHYCDTKQQPAVCAPFQ